MDEKIVYLRSIAIFKDLDEVILEKLSDLLFLRKFPRKYYLFYEGEPGDTLFLVKEGKVKLFLSHNDQEKIVQVVTKGRIFPEVVFDEGSYPLTAETLEETVVYAIRTKDYYVLMQEHPELALRMLGFTCKNIRRTFRQIKNLAMKNARERLASKLFSLAIQFGEKSNEGTKITIPLTIEDTAKMIGTTRETANRILLEFKKDKIIKIQAHYITILDEKKLRIWL